jgi:hypothetical protein
MKKNVVVFLPALIFIIIGVAAFVACNKPQKSQATSFSSQNNTTPVKLYSSVAALPIAYKGSDGAFVSVNYDQIEKLYKNNKVLDTPQYSLYSAEIINAIDENGNSLLGLRTKLKFPDVDKYVSITSTIFQATNADKAPIYVFGNSPAEPQDTYTCSCEGTCSSGCDASHTGVSFCSCSPCFPSANTCNKKSSVVYTSEAFFE